MKVIGPRVNSALRIGTVISVAVIVIGLAAYAMSPGDDAAIPLGDLLPSLLDGSPVAIVTLGMVCLVSMPLLRVLASLAGFLTMRDVTYAIVTAIVLVVIVSGLLV